MKKKRWLARYQLRINAQPQETTAFQTVIDRKQATLDVIPVVLQRHRDRLVSEPLGDQFHVRAHVDVLDRKRALFHRRVECAATADDQHVTHTKGKFDLTGRVR
jgi:hypothetical protein